MTSIKMEAFIDHTVLHDAIRSVIAAEQISAGGTDVDGGGPAGSEPTEPSVDGGRP